jgi:DNA-binding response OmpR family regulator
MIANGTPSMREADRDPQDGGILLVEADAELRRAVNVCLKTRGWIVYPAGDPEEASRILARVTPEILVLMGLESRPELEGSLIDKFRSRHKGRRRGSVLIAVDRRPEDAWRRKYHPDAVIFKPFDVRYLSRKLSMLSQTDVEESAESAGNAMGDALGGHPAGRCP